MAPEEEYLTREVEEESERLFTDATDVARSIIDLSSVQRMIMWNNMFHI